MPKTSSGSASTSIRRGGLCAAVERHFPPGLVVRDGREIAQSTPRFPSADEWRGVGSAPTPLVFHLRMENGDEPAPRLRMAAAQTEKASGRTTWQRQGRHGAVLPASVAAMPRRAGAALVAVEAPQEAVCCFIAKPGVTALAWSR